MRGVRWMGLAGVVLVLAACGGGQRAARVEAPPPAVRKVDPFPLYELTTRAATPDVHVDSRAVGWACTVFVAGGIVERNFDFHDQPALILHHRPPGAYASVSMVDLSSLGFDRAHLGAIGAPGAAAKLAAAARMPFDGMNEKGLVVTMAAVPHARSPKRARATGELGVMRLALDHAADVAQAIRIFRDTAVDFSDGPPIHYLVADASGAAAVIEYVDGAVEVLRGARVMTNFVLSRPHGRPDRRYRTASAGRATARDPARTLALLRRVRQPITRWSVAYDMRHRTLEVVMGQRYDRVLRFSV
jgi:Acyl-coenzyme A:6-aminopenicillanic acid acyl-transferase